MCPALGRLTCAAVLALVFLEPQRSFALTPDELLDNGIAAYDQKLYADAARFLFAYSEQDPALLRNDAQFRSQFNTAFQYAIQNIAEDREELERLRRQAREREQEGNIGSGVSGLTIAPPVLRRPNLTSAAAAAAAASTVAARDPSTNVVATVACVKPSTPVLTSPATDQVQPNHYYGRGSPWRFEWQPSSCGARPISYRITVTAEGAAAAAVDAIVTEPRYVGDTTGTIAARRWIVRVQALTDDGKTSDWTEPRPFQVAEWTGQ
jgi:hypothetical protein